MVRASLPNMAATLEQLAAPARRALDEAITKCAADAGSDLSDPQKAGRFIAETDHLSAIQAWCRDNPELAAAVVMAAVYWTSGNFRVQEVEVLNPDAEQAPEGEAAPEAQPQG